MRALNLVACILVFYFGAGVVHGRVTADPSFAELVVSAETDALSAKSLGYMYIKGRGVKKDVYKGLFYLERAADLGDDSSIKFLIKAYTSKSSPMYDLAKFQALRTRLVGSQQPKVRWPGSEQLVTSLNDTKAVPSGTGSAFAVTEDGFFVSNHHVTDSCDHMVARYNGQYGVIRQVAADAKRDLSLLKMGALTPHFANIRSSNVAIGEEVNIGGFPVEPGSEMVTTDFVFSTGVVGTLPELDGVRHMRVSAAVASGNSGGPAVDARGLLIGVAVAKIPAGRLSENVVIGDNYNYLVSNKELLDFLVSKNTNFQVGGAAKALTSLEVASLLQKISAQIICFAK